MHSGVFLQGSLYIRWMRRNIRIGWVATLFDFILGYRYLDN